MLSTKSFFTFKKERSSCCVYYAPVNETQTLPPWDIGGDWF